MTVAAQTTFNPYTGNGVTTVFPYQFKILDQGDLAVYVAGVLKTIGVDYTVSGVGADLGGSVTFIVPPAALASVSIVRAMTVQRTTDYQQQGDFNASTVNPDFDRPILMIQDVNTQLGRTIRAPADEVGTILVLPSIANRLGKFISFDAAGQPTASVGTGNDTALRTDLASQTSGGNTLVAYLKTAAENAAAVTVVNAYREPGNITRYKTGSTNTDGTNDWSAAILAATKQCVLGGADVVVPAPTVAGFYRHDGNLVLTGGSRIRGDGTQPTIRFYAGGITIPAGSAFNSIEGLDLTSCDGGGALDPRNQSAIKTLGTSGSNTTHLTVERCHFRGWNRVFDWSYTWYSKIDKCYTINCNVGLRMFGQCVTNFLSNSHLIVNGGTHSIQLVKDVAVQGEGLHINNCLLANGTYGIQSDGFLSMNLTGVEIDQVADTGLDFTNVQAFHMVGGWVYAANRGAVWNNLGVLVDQQSGFSQVRIQVTAANGQALRIGGNNKGINVCGGTLISGPSGTARCSFIDVSTDAISFTGVHLVNNNAATAMSIFVGGAGFRHAGLTGDVTIQYNAPDQYTGTLTQGTTAPTAQIIYSETGDTITLQIPALAAVSANTNPPKITGMPAAIRPLTKQTKLGVVVNNSAEVVGKVDIETNGDLTLWNGFSAVFTAANSKGINPCTISYRRF